MDPTSSKPVSISDANPGRLQAIEAQMARLQQEQQAILAMDSYQTSSAHAQQSFSTQSQHHGALSSPAAAAMPGRSKSHMGTRASHAPPMTNQDRRQSKKLKRTISQQAYDSYPVKADGQTMPFKPTAHVAPLQRTPMARSLSTPYGQNHSALYDQVSQSFQPSPTEIAVPDVGMSPEEYFSSHSFDYDSILRDAGPMDQADWPHIPEASQCPSIFSGVTAPDFASPMTRQPSYMASTPMIPASSSRSFGFPVSSTGAYEDGNSNSMDFGKQPSTDHYLLGMGLGMTQDGQSFMSAQTTLSPDMTLEGLATEMQRTCSSISTASNKSESKSEQRCREARLRAIEAAQANKIAPKPQDKSDEIEAIQEAVKESVKPASSGYQRARQPRVACCLCPELTEFRGEHELQRHKNLKHKGLVKKWICKVPDPEGSADLTHPIIPLEQCQNCMQGKEYGADYNAAAHLRRKHFKPKDPQNKSAKVPAVEKRGGKAGGDWPPMDELRHWLGEKYVHKTEAAGSKHKANSTENVDLEPEVPLIMPFDASSAIMNTLAEHGPFGHDPSAWIMMPAADPFPSQPVEDSFSSIHSDVFNGITATL